VTTGPLAVDVSPLTPDRLDDLGAVLRGGWGATCWCTFPRLTDAQARALPGEGPPAGRRRDLMAGLAGAAEAPGLLAYAASEPVGAPAVEAHPRAGGLRTADGNAYVGTEEMFRRAGFRGPLTGVPRTWIPRVAMRAGPPLLPGEP
jgi:hypothetical protein